MEMKNIVVERMEERLSKYGFWYKEYKDYRWKFIREVEGVIQSIVIQRSRWGKSYTLEIDAGYGSYRPQDITNDPEYNLDFLDFNSKEEQISALNRLLDVVEKFGLKKLEKIIQEAKATGELIRPTNYMYKKLYENNSMLMQQFVERNHAEGLAEDGILQILKKELEIIKGKDFEMIQNKLIELASVYGNMLIRKVGGRWEYNEYNDRVIMNLDIPLYPGYPLLDWFIERWQKGEEDLIIEEYNIKCSEIINWARACRKLHGDDWQSKSSYARCKYKIPLL